MINCVFIKKIMIVLQKKQTVQTLVKTSQRLLLMIRLNNSLMINSLQYLQKCGYNLMTH